MGKKAVRKADTHPQAQRRLRGGVPKDPGDKVERTLPGQILQLPV